MDRPILFNTEMVKAILDGRKTMTRRIIKTSVKNDFQGFVFDSTDNSKVGKCMFGKGCSCEYIKPLYQAGDILWVRETFYQYGEWFDIPQTDEYGDIIEKRSFIPQNANEHPIYFADTLPSGIKVLKGYKSGRGYYKRPSLFMPREAARIFLKVTNIKAERLQDITEDGAKEEGFQVGDKPFGGNSSQTLTAKQSFMWTWKMLYDKGDYPWVLNPWIWVISFEKVTR